MGAPTNRSNSKNTESIPRKLVREIKRANGEMNMAVVCGRDYQLKLKEGMRIVGARAGAEARVAECDIIHHETDESRTSVSVGIAIFNGRRQRCATDNN